MRRGIKVRLLAFVLLSALGMVYVGASYLGFVDKVLGRGYSVTVLLPQSGGLFTGSEVTYRGVKIGEVSKMTVQGKGLRVDVALEEDARVPKNSPVFVHNLSAVGEQYLSFEPDSRQGPMLQAGDVVRGDKDSLPLGEEVLMQDLSAFVLSVNGDELNTVVNELGTMFRDNATPLRSMVDSTQAFVEAAQANQTPTIDLLHHAQTVLQTQADNSANIRSFSADLAALTGTVASSDANIRKILNEAGPAADELVRLVRNLRKVLPPFLKHLVSVSEVLDARLPALEQLLVTFPRLVSAGPSALLSEGDVEVRARQPQPEPGTGALRERVPPARLSGGRPPSWSRRRRHRSPRMRPSTRGINAAVQRRPAGEHARDEVRAGSRRLRQWIG